MRFIIINSVLLVFYSFIEIEPLIYQYKSNYKKMYMEDTDFI